MTTQEIYSLVSISLCLIGMLVYNGYVIIRYKKIPVSLSETAYILGGESSLGRYWFTLYCLFTAATVLPSLFMCTKESLEFLPFLVCTGLLFAGFSPAFKSSVEKEVHYVSAIISFISFLLYGIFYMSWYWLVSYLVVLGALCICKINITFFFPDT